MLTAFLRAGAREQLRLIEATLLPWLKESRDRDRVVRRYLQAARRVGIVTEESQRQALEELRALSRLERLQFGPLPGEEKASQETE